MSKALGRGQPHQPTHLTGSVGNQSPSQGLSPTLARPANLGKGQEGQLELDLRDLPHHVLAGESEVDAGGVDVGVPELLLKRI